MPFKVGDKVEHRSLGLVEVAYGPFEHLADPGKYLVKHESGKHTLVVEESLTVVGGFKVGDRVRTSVGTRAVVAGPFVGHSEWYALRRGDGRVFKGEVSGMTLDTPAASSGYTYKGTVYECGVTYTDSFGDRFSFTRPAAGGEPRSDSTSWASGVRLSDAVDDLGPLSKA